LTIKEATDLQTKNKSVACQLMANNPNFDRNPKGAVSNRENAPHRLILHPTETVENYL